MITSTHNPLVQRIRALQTRRRDREREGRFVLEGVRLLEEACAARVGLEAVLHVTDLDPRSVAALAAAERAGARPVPVTPAVLRACADTETPAGLLAIAELPVPTPPTAPRAVLVLDGLADPGNVGTLLRTAAAAGLDAVYLAPGTVDAYSPKVVRAALGAHFRVPVLTFDWAEPPAAWSALRLYVADMDQGPAYDSVDWRAPAGLIVGAEASGASAAARASAISAVHIPMPGGAESLNAAVAGSVIIFELARQRRTT
ncbi:MAG: RNA methyltransferase [Anaerolineales bacterium]|nr:RNA methyltransferase [Anaerolineales bacterium]